MKILASNHELFLKNLSNDVKNHSLLREYRVIKHRFRFFQQDLFVIISRTIMSQKQGTHTRSCCYGSSLARSTMIIYLGTIFLIRCIGTLMI